MECSWKHQIFNVLVSKKKKKKLAYLFLAYSKLPPELLAKNKKPSENNAVFGTYIYIYHDFFQGTAKPQNRRGNQSGIRPSSCSNNYTGLLWMAITGDILERILRASVLKNVHMNISKFIYAQ